MSYLSKAFSSTVNTENVKSTLSRISLSTDIWCDIICGIAIDHNVIEYRTRSTGSRYVYDSPVDYIFSNKNNPVPITGNLIYILYCNRNNYKELIYGTQLPKNHESF